MRNGVKGHTEIEEDEDGDETGVSCHEEVIGDFYEGCFCPVAGTETKLELFVKAVLGEMGVKLGSNIFFLGFWK